MHHWHDQSRYCYFLLPSIFLLLPSFFFRLPFSFFLLPPLSLEGSRKNEDGRRKTEVGSSSNSTIAANHASDIVIFMHEYLKENQLIPSSWLSCDPVLCIVTFSKACSACEWLDFLRIRAKSVIERLMLFSRVCAFGFLVRTRGCSKKLATRNENLRHSFQHLQF